MPSCSKSAWAGVWTQSTSSMPTSPIVTSIALDHCDWLGTDVETIGREKAGIFRAGRPAIFGSRDMPAIDCRGRRSARHATATARTRLRLAPRRRALDVARTRTRLRRSAAARVGGEIAVRQRRRGAVRAGMSCRSRCPWTRGASSGPAERALPGRFQVVAPDDRSRSNGSWMSRTIPPPRSARRAARGATAQAAAPSPSAAFWATRTSKASARALRGAFDAWVVVGLDSARAVTSTQLC